MPLPTPGSIVIYATSDCPELDAALRTLRSDGAAGVERVILDDDPDAWTEMSRLSGSQAAPQFFIGLRPVGGLADLERLARTGELAVLIQAVNAV